MAQRRVGEDNLNRAMETNARPRIIVQGGAYSMMLGHLSEEYKRATKESAKTGYDVLMRGGTPVDAVEAAVRVFEGNEYFNAGFGSYLNCEGEVECDALIMEGHTLKSGAVMAGRRFRNPVSLCKKIMYQSPHCALSGDGAFKFAQDVRFDICDPTELKSKYAIGIAHSDYKEYVEHHYKGVPVPVKSSPDTVSAVAMDADGQLACATSTGGMPGKLKGRVGDAPLIGCGGYANKTGAATVTGVGESIMQMTLGREVVYYMENGQNAQDAAQNALEKMKAFDGSLGGVIAIDKNGNFGKSFNTEKMVWASIADNTMKSGLEKDEVKTEHL